MNIATNLLSVIGPLVGVCLGWLLKSSSDRRTRFHESRRILYGSLLGTGDRFIEVLNDFAALSCELHTEADSHARERLPELWRIRMPIERELRARFHEVDLVAAPAVRIKAQALSNWFFNELAATALKQEDAAVLAEGFGEKHQHLYEAFVAAARRELGVK